MDGFSKYLGSKPKGVVNRWAMREERKGRGKDSTVIPGLPDWGWRVGHHRDIEYCRKME